MCSDGEPPRDSRPAPWLRLVRPAMDDVEYGDLRARAQALGVPYIRPPARIPPACRRALPPGLARALRAVPIGRTRHALTVAMDDPRNAAAILRLRAATGLAIFPVLAPAAEIERALARLDARPRPRA